MKIAVSVNEDRQISPHFGMSREVDIYSIEKDEIKFVETRAVPGGLQGHHFEFIMDCQAIISGSIGYPMQERLRQEGIEPFISDSGDPITGIRELLGTYS